MSVYLAMLPLSNCKCSKFASEYSEIANKDHRKKHDQGPGAVLSIIHQKVFQLETLLFCLVVHLRSSLKHSARINRQTATGGGRDAERCNSKSARMRKGLHWGFRWSLWALGQVILKTRTLSYLELIFISLWHFFEPRYFVIQIFNWRVKPCRRSAQSC